MEGDAGTGRLNPIETDSKSDVNDPSDAVPAVEHVDPAPSGGEVDGGSDGTQDPADPADEATVDRRPERFGRGWVALTCVALLLVAAGLAVGGYYAILGHRESTAIARDDNLALERAKECVAATQAPDVAAMTASQSKIIECATGDFGVQANLYSSMLVEVYQVANVAVQVSDLRAAVEKHYDDGSVDVLVAVRVKVSNAQAADQEQGYRLRVKMAPVDGTYKVDRLDQVTS